MRLAWGPSDPEATQQEMAKAQQRLAQLTNVDRDNPEAVYQALVP